ERYSLQVSADSRRSMIVIGTPINKGSKKDVHTEPLALQLADFYIAQESERFLAEKHYAGKVVYHSLHTYGQRIILILDEAAQRSKRGDWLGYCEAKLPELRAYVNQKYTRVKGSALRKILVDILEQSTRENVDAFSI